MSEIIEAYLPDYSKWQGTLDRDTLVQLWMEGKLIGLIIRTSYAMIEDQKFRETCEMLRSLPAEMLARIWIGTYHYLSSGVPWLTQLSLVLRLLAVFPFDFFALDVETAYNKMGKKFAIWAILFHKEFKKRLPGFPIILYTNKTIYQDYLRPYHEDFDEMLLWLAQYPYSVWTRIAQIFVRDHQAIIPKTAHRENLILHQVTAYAKGATWGSKSQSQDLNTIEVSHERFAQLIPINPVRAFYDTNAVEPEIPAITDDPEVLALILAAEQSGIELGRRLERKGRGEELEQLAIDWLVDV